MNIFAYICLFYSGFVFSVSTWNRCLALAGKTSKEPHAADWFTAFAFPAFTFAIKQLFFV